MTRLDSHFHPSQNGNSQEGSAVSEERAAVKYFSGSRVVGKSYLRLETSLARCFGERKNQSRKKYEGL